MVAEMSSTDHTTDTDQLSLPKSEARWAELTIDSLSLLNKDEHYTHDHLRDVAHHHAEQVVSRTDLDVDLDLVDWKPTYALKNAHGKHHRRQGRSLITLSMHSLETNGWGKMLKTVRHELVHAWQYQHDRWDDGCNHWERSHGSEFEQWMNILAVTKRGGRVGASAPFVVSCPDCSNEWEYHRECVTTKSTRYGQNCCPDCGKGTTQGRLELYEDGIRQLTATMPNEECDSLMMLKGIDEEMISRLKSYDVETVEDVVASLLSEHTYYPEDGLPVGVPKPEFHIHADGWLGTEKADTVAHQVGLLPVETIHGDREYIEE